MNKLGKKAFLSTDFSAFKQEFLQKSETLCLISLLYSWFQFVQRPDSCHRFRDISIKAMSLFFFFSTLIQFFKKSVRIIKFYSDRVFYLFVLYTHLQAMKC